MWWVLLEGQGDAEAKFPTGPPSKEVGGDSRTLEAGYDIIFIDRVSDCALKSI